MIFFILIFFVAVVAVALSIAFDFPFRLKRRAAQVQSINQKQFAHKMPQRSLFEPNDEETRAFEREAAAQKRAEKIAAVQKVSAEKVELWRETQNVWLDEPNRRETIKLLRLATETEDAKIFSETAENVLKAWRGQKIAGLSAADLADLLDSHWRTLPQQERTAGALFWLRRAIAGLRAGSEEKFDG